MTHNSWEWLIWKSIGSIWYYFNTRLFQREHFVSENFWWRPPSHWIYCQWKCTNPSILNHKCVVKTMCDPSLPLWKMKQVGIVNHLIWASFEAYRGSTPSLDAFVSSNFIAIRPCTIPYTNHINCYITSLLLKRVIINHNKRAGMFT